MRYINMMLVAVFFFSWFGAVNAQDDYTDTMSCTVETLDMVQVNTLLAVELEALGITAQEIDHNIFVNNDGDVVWVYVEVNVSAEFEQETLYFSWVLSDDCSPVSTEGWGCVWTYDVTFDMVVESGSSFDWYYDHQTYFVGLDLSPWLVQGVEFNVYEVWARLEAWRTEQNLTYTTATRTCEYVNIARIQVSGVGPDSVVYWELNGDRIDVAPTNIEERTVMNEATGEQQVVYISVLVRGTRTVELGDYVPVNEFGVPYTDVWVENLNTGESEFRPSE